MCVYIYSYIYIYVCETSHMYFRYCKGKHTNEFTFLDWFRFSTIADRNICMWSVTKSSSGVVNHLLI